MSGALEEAATLMALGVRVDEHEAQLRHHAPERPHVERAPVTTLEAHLRRAVVARDDATRKWPSRQGRRAVGVGLW